MYRDRRCLTIKRSQELQAQGSLFGSQTPSGHSRPTSPNPLRESMTNGSAAMQKERSYDSLAKEIGQLQNGEQHNARSPN